MPEPWKCPDCGLWLAPGTAAHRCGEQSSAAEPEKPTSQPGYAGHNGGSFDRAPAVACYEPVRTWGFRP